MKALVWLGVGAVGGLALLLARRRAETTDAPAPVQPPKTYGESTRVSLSVPAGWRRVNGAEVTPDLQAEANALRGVAGFSSLPYGTLVPFTASNGSEYGAWVEQHYHEPGGPAKPWGLHHGVTLLAKI